MNKGLIIGLSAFGIIIVILIVYLIVSSNKKETINVYTQPSDSNKTTSETNSGSNWLGVLSTTISTIGGVLSSGALKKKEKEV